MASSSTTPTILGGLGPDIVHTYQTIRYSKMAQATARPSQAPNIPSLVQSLTASPNTFCSVRVHFYTIDLEQSLPDSVSASLFQSFIKYAKPFSCEVVYKDDSSEVFDIGFAKDLIKIFLTDGKILSLLAKANLIEVYSLSEPKTSQSFIGNDSVRSLPTSFLRAPLTYARPAITVQDTPPELLDLWIAFLRYKWSEFFAEIEYRQCSLVYYTNGQYQIRRKFSSTRPAIFTHSSDLSYLKDLQVVAVIPNCHPADITQRPLIIDACIDVDPSRFTTDKEKIFVSNALTEFLTQRSLVFQKRLSSGSHHGFHFNIKIKVDSPFDTITNIASAQNYFNNLEEKIIINSVREALVAVMLGLLKTYKSDGILNFVSLDSNPYKTNLDLSRNVLNGGKRALYSMHERTTSIVLPLPNKELLTETSFQAYTKLAQLDVAYANADSIHESPLVNSDITKNTAILGYLTRKNYRLWKAYHMAPNKAAFLTKM